MTALERKKRETETGSGSEVCEEKVGEDKEAREGRNGEI